MAAGEAIPRVPAPAAASADREQKLCYLCTCGHGDPISSTFRCKVCGWKWRKEQLPGLRRTATGNLLGTRAEILARAAALGMTKVNSIVQPGGAMGRR